MLHRLLNTVRERWLHNRVDGALGQIAVMESKLHITERENQQEEYQIQLLGAETALLDV